jgi:thiamine kinase-like enzyme
LESGVVSSFTLTDEQLGQVFDQIPVLSGQPRLVEDLPGGLTNRNVKVTTPGGIFVARCTGTEPSMLDIDRTAEHANSCAAEQSGVGAPVFDFRPDLGVLVIGYLAGRTLHRTDLDSPTTLARIATACRRLHSGPRFVNTFDMFERQPGYLATVQRGGYRLPDGYLELGDRLHGIRAALSVLDEGTVPCNNDLLAENFVDDGQKVWIIDYEYSGNNDACFELGNIWAEAGLSVDQLAELVTAYYGHERPNKLARAQLLGIVGQYGWTLWGAIQNAVSPIDFDFWSWTMEHFDTAAAGLRSPDLNRLLDAVRTPD